MIENANSFSYRYFPVQEFRIFMQVDGENLLVASYFSGGDPPDVGQILDIKVFKQEPGYPDAVRILSLEEHYDVVPSGTTAVIIYSVTAEPV